MNANTKLLRDRRAYTAENRCGTMDAEGMPLDLCGQDERFFTLASHRESSCATRL